MSDSTVPPAPARAFRILVTGATGAIGRAVCESLERHRLDVQKTLPDVRYEVIRAARSLGFDLRNPPRDLTKERYSVVIHAAATPYVDVEDAGRARVIQDDLDLTYRALNVGSRLEGVIPPHFIFLSSMLVYENVPGTDGGERIRPLKEVDTNLDFHVRGEALAAESRLQFPTEQNPIGFSKLLGEAAVRANSRMELPADQRCTHTIWRLANVISPHEPHDQRGHIIVNLYRQLFIERVPELQLGPAGFQVRTFTWVDDVADMIVAGIGDQRLINGTFNLATDEPRSITELARVMMIVGRMLGMLPEGYNPSVSIDSSKQREPSTIRVMDVSKLRNAIGRIPSTRMSLAVEKFLRAKRAEQFEKEGRPVP